MNRPEPSTATLQLPESVSVQDVRNVLESFLRVVAAAPSRAHQTFYDTYEWNLWFEGLVLYHHDGKTVCASLDQGWPGATIEESPAETMPARFASNWPESPLRDLVAPLSGLRALMPVADIATSTCTMELLNSDHKVVFRFDIISLYASEKEQPPYARFCRLRPLRGYTREAKQATQCLESLGFKPTESGPLQQALAKAGHVPAPYTLRPVFGLKADETCREAVRDIVRSMLVLARKQEDGIIQDIDTEFLHDYRICLRKIRSVISLMKGVYPEEETQRLKAEWAELGRATNRLRDLDVYLLDRENYINLLPPSLQEGLHAFFENIRKERAEVQQSVSKHFADSGYLKRIETLSAFFTEPDRLPASEKSQEPVLTFASERIYKRYRKIQKASRALTHDTPDEAIHQIRIECKKLRYMLEFFGELFDPEGLAKLVKQLKAAQNILGRFNDYAVQQESLLQYWAEHKMTVTVDQALSIGGLIAVLNRQQVAERSRAEKALLRFSKRDVHAAFKKTFQLPAPKVL